MNFELENFNTNVISKMTDIKFENKTKHLTEKGILNII